METRTITIIGGGLAGLTLGIALRQRDIPVEIWEAGHYPRHKVCGEFVSGRGQQTLARLGLFKTLERAGAVIASTAAFFAGRHATPVMRLPSSAVCISRYKLDAALADEFMKAGGVLHSGQRRDCAPGVGIVRATGRRRGDGRKGVRWWGMKVHARNVRLTADLEMHISSRGYVGLCRLSGGVVNVCGLFRPQVGGRSGGGPRVGGHQKEAWLGMLGAGVLSERLSEVEFDDSSYCAVAGVSLRPERAAGEELRIGDAITMIPPITGNGMSMALESAELAVEPLVNWVGGALEWRQAREAVAAACDRAFSTRLAWAKRLQALLGLPGLGPALPCLAARRAWLWRFVFARTRDGGPDGP